MSLPPDATDPPPSLDPAAIDKLRELDPSGKQQVVQRVLNAYEQSLERMLGELRAARPVRNLDTIARIAHTLKSSSASVGALALSRRCAEAEKVLRSGEEGRWDAELDSLLHEGDRALVAVRAMLHS